MPEHRALIRRWLQASTAETVLALQAPWVKQGWFDDATAWIQAQLAQRHIQAVGPIVQERVWALSCVMRVGVALLLYCLKSWFFSDLCGSPVQSTLRSSDEFQGWPRHRHL